MDASIQYRSNSMQHHKDAVAGHSEPLSDIGDFGILTVSHFKHFAASSSDSFQANL